MFKNKISCDYYHLPSQNPEIIVDKNRKEEKKSSKKLSLLPITSSPSSPSPPSAPPTSPTSPLPTLTSQKDDRLLSLMKKIEKKIDVKKKTLKKVPDQKKKSETVGKKIQQKKKSEIAATTSVVAKKREKRPDQIGKQKITNRALKKFEKEFLPYHSPSGQHRLKKLNDKKSK